MTWLLVNGRLVNADHIVSIRPVVGPSPAIIFEIGYRRDGVIKRLPDCAPAAEVVNSILDQLYAGKDVVNVDCIVALHEALKENQE